MIVRGTDEVKLTVGSVTYEWKVKDAERMVAELHSKMFAAGASGSPAPMSSEAPRSQGDDKSTKRPISLLLAAYSMRC